LLLEVVSRVGHLHGCQEVRLGSVEVAECCQCVAGVNPDPEVVGPADQVGRELLAGRLGQTGPSQNDRDVGVIERLTLRLDLRGCRRLPPARPQICSESSGRFAAKQTADLQPATECNVTKPTKQACCRVGRWGSSVERAGGVTGTPPRP
jgi:hypothetical protein